MKIMNTRILKTHSFKNTNTDMNTNPTNPTNHIILKLCSRTKKNTSSSKCANAFCKFNDVEKNCVLNMNANQLEYFSYLLANDLINNKLESAEIFNGAFIPEFNLHNKLFNNPNDIMINPAELSTIWTYFSDRKYCR